jgi:hypothetical protein
MPEEDVDPATTSLNADPPPPPEEQQGTDPGTKAVGGRRGPKPEDKGQV